MTPKYVYLAGPILGCTEGQAKHWRRYVDDKLTLACERSIVGISPLRCEPLVGDLYDGEYHDKKFGSYRAIASKNFYDLQVCDFVLIYLPRTQDPTRDKEVSVGTIWELGIAFAMRKPIIVVSDNPHVMNHPDVKFSANWLLDNLDDAVDVLVGIMGGYVGGKNV